MKVILVTDETVCLPPPPNLYNFLLNYLQTADNSMNKKLYRLGGGGEAYSFICNQNHIYVMPKIKEKCDIRQSITFKLVQALLRQGKKGFFSRTKQPVGPKRTNKQCIVCANADLTQFCSTGAKSKAMGYDGDPGRHTRGVGNVGQHPSYLLTPFGHQIQGSTLGVMLG